MSKKLTGKVAIVTASTVGIGFAIAKRLARDGASVVISSRRQQNVDRAVAEVTSDGGKAFGMVCHVAKKEDRIKLFNEMTESAWDKVFDINVKASFFLAKEVVPHMEKRGGGNIVFVSSVEGYDPSPMVAQYGVSKTALLGLTKAMLTQCAALNIRVNGIAPGLIKTRFSRAIWQDGTDLSNAAIDIPMGRAGSPDECAGAVSFLVSDDASYITGETIIMSGGKAPRL